MSTPALLPQLPAGGALTEIAACIRALIAPSPALFYAYADERRRLRNDGLCANKVALEELGADAFAAAVRLMSLEALPAPVQGNAVSYMDVIALTLPRKAR